MNTSFEKAKNSKVEWLTPPELVKKFGDFDLDPCSPINPPFVHATTNYTVEDNGLEKNGLAEFFAIHHTEEICIFGWKS